MAYVALKTFDGPGGVKRRPGDVVPEAITWPNPQPWINAGWVKWVSDSEISGDRWKDYDKYAGGRAVGGGPAGVARVAAPAAAPAAAAKPDDTKPSVVVPPAVSHPKLTKKELASHTKDELGELAEKRGVAVSSSMSKSDIIEAILDAS